jgi:hypothetical protein
LAEVSLEVGDIDHHHQEDRWVAQWEAQEAEVLEVEDIWEVQVAQVPEDMAEAQVVLDK